MGIDKNDIPELTQVRVLVKALSYLYLFLISSDLICEVFFKAVILPEHVSVFSVLHVG